MANIEKNLTLDEMANAQSSIKEVQSMLTEAQQRGSQVPSKLILGVYHADCILHDYKRLFSME